MKQFHVSLLPHAFHHTFRTILIAALLALSLVVAGFSFWSAPKAAAGPNNYCQQPKYPCVNIWATNVNVRYWPNDPTQKTGCQTYPSRSCAVVDHLAGPNEPVLAFCQRAGEQITADGHTNNWWTLLVGDNGQIGWTTNIYITGGKKISGVPDCSGNYIY